jgi:DNA repair exonuclease SbcCD ATPase subunit
MKIKSLKAKNFFSIGEKALEIDFTQYGNLVVILGKNLDVDDEGDDIEHFSNAAGKSTISEALVYGFHGKTIRNKVSHAEVINNINKKKLEVEVIFSLDDIEYRILRTRKPDSLHVWKNDNEITLGGIPATQKLLDSIIGLNHKAFINVACFGQHNSYNFLDCDPAEQRSIVESVLCLDVYKNYSDSAKDELRVIKSKVKDYIAEYERTQQLEASCAQRIKQIQTKQEEWKNNGIKELTQLKLGLDKVKNEQSSVNLNEDFNSYEVAQNEIEKIESQLPKLIEFKKTLTDSLDIANKKYNEVREKRFQENLNAKQLSQELEQSKEQSLALSREINDLESQKEGATCPICSGTISISNYKHMIILKKNQIDCNKGKVEILSKKMQLINESIKKHDEFLKNLKESIDAADNRLSITNKTINQHQSKINDLVKVKKPDLNSNEMVLQERIRNFEEKIVSKTKELEEKDPYQEILISTKNELQAIKQKCFDCKMQIVETESDVPYYEFWHKAFSDDGIRSFIIDGIVPSLNNRVDYWMQFLLNNKLKVKFDNQLDATIERNPPNGDPFTYNAMCGGERRRIDLAISQAFAHVLMLSSGTNPSLVFLDEIGTNIDQKGIANIYNMITQLSNEKQVFVITHDANLLDMLKGADTIVI